MIAKKIREKKLFTLYIYRKRKLEKTYRIRRDTLRRIHKSKNVKKTSPIWNQLSFFGFVKRTNFIRNKKVRLKLHNNEAIIVIPKVFSLIKNPEETISIYNQLYQIAKNKSIDKVYFDHSQCKELGLGASTVMDVFVMNLEAQRKQIGQEIYLHGELPQDPYINTFLQISGILKHLNINKDIDNIVKNTHGIEKLDLIKGGRHTPTLKIQTNINSANTSTEISNYFNKCLNTQGYELTDGGYSLMCHMIGEVIDNCQIHSGEFSQWFTLGNYFIDPVDKIGECNLVIFNFGQTIYEGLKQYIDSIDPESTNQISITLKKSLEELTELHSSNGFFGPTWNEEILWTLYALQDGVSRCISDEEPDRGTGTVRLIEAFQEIGNTVNGKKPEMCLVSGKAQIIFTGEYSIKEELKNGETRQIIAFNNENELRKLPDKKYVKLLNNYFPGTIISMKFYLDRKYIEKVLEEDRDE